MATFGFNLLTHSPERLNVISTRLGATKAEKFTDADVGKAVKLGDQSNHILCAQGDEIAAFVDNIDSGGTNGGFSFGGVARGNRGFRVKAVIGANQGATAAKLNDLVVADDQVAVNTAGAAQVITGTPSTNKWRIMAMNGDGTAGTEVILELC